RVAVESTFAVQRVIGRRERTTRHCGDEVDLVEQRMLFAVRRGDLHVAQRLEHAERERGGTSAAAGKRDDHEELVGVGVDAGRKHGCRQRDDLFQRLCAGVCGAAAGKQDCKPERTGQASWAHEIHAVQYTVRASLSGGATSYTSRTRLRIW